MVGGETMPKSSTRSYAIAALLCVIVVGAAMYYLHYVTAKMEAEAKGARLVVKLARSLPTSDVKKIYLSLEPNRRNDIILKSPDDACDIRRLMGAIHRITVTDRECPVYTQDMIVIYCWKSGGVVLYGNFDPDNAPVISPAMRSNDLAKIIYDIYRRRGIEPRGKSK
jgi:hypothetical protein